MSAEKDIEQEKLRITRYFRKIMKLVAKEILAKKLISKEDVYSLCENRLIEENISSNPIYIKYKFTDKFLPKVTLKMEFISLKLPIKMGLKGSYTIVRPTHTQNQNNLFVNNYVVKECKTQY